MWWLPFSPFTLGHYCPPRRQTCLRCEFCSPVLQATVRLFCMANPVPQKLHSHTAKLHPRYMAPTEHIFQYKMLVFNLSQ